MQNFVKTLSLSFLLQIITFGATPEFFIEIRDNPGAYYVIVAERFNNNPVYNENYNFTTQYDFCLEQTGLDGNPVSYWAGPDVFISNRGFDFLPTSNPGLNGRGILAYGIYKISILRNVLSEPEIDCSSCLLFTFYLDLRISYQTYDPDIIFKFDRLLNGTVIATVEENPLAYGETVNFWTVHGLQKDWSEFIKDVTLSNDFNGAHLSNISIELNAATEGFPETVYPIGYLFSNGENAEFWKQGLYDLKVPEYQTYNNNNYKIRNWNSDPPLGYGSELNERLNDNNLIAYYYPSKPVVVLNNLEGGTSIDQFTITWQNTGGENIFSYGTEYNAFQYNETNHDRYSFQASPITSQRYNTTWSFFNWNNGSNTSTISDIRIPDDIPTVGSFIANYKGHLRFNNFDSFNTSGQRHLVRDADGYYHLFYISLDDILWYTKSLNTNFNGTWSTEYDLLPEVKNVSAYIDDNKIYLVLEMKSETNCLIHCWILAAEDGDLLDYFDVANITPSYWGNAHPTVAATENERMFVYRKSSTGGLYYKRWWFNGHIWYEYPETYISNSSFSSLNPSLYMQKNDPANIFHLAYEDGIELTSIKYVYTSGGTFGTPRNISDASGYNFNTNPSLSLFKKDLSTYQPIVSWLGSNGGGLEKGEGISIPTPRLIVRACDNFLAGTWGSTNVYGEEVSSTQNNSVIGLLNQSIITWGQKDGTESKWVKRDGTTYYGPYCMYPAGHNTNISNGTSFSNLKALTFNKESLPYIISPNTIGFAGTPNCGGEEKVVTAYPFTFSRAGVILKKGVEFAYHTGDVVVDDSAIQFIEVPDTLSFGNSVELNQILRTMDFPLNSNSSLIFSNYYYVLNKEMADSLSAEDAVSYRVELVNSTSGSIAGTFDNITYNKNNLEDYENISYQIDCSGITEGNYYFRLVTAVTGDAEYNLINAVNDAGTVAKRSSNKISFTGDKIPDTYDLSQNFPNPFNPVTTINYQLLQSGHVTLKIYDILGKEVGTLVNEQKTHGRYTVNFDASKLASGVYIYQIRVNDYVSSKKMLLLK